MLLYALITLTLLSFGAIVGFFALQGKVRAWRLAAMERSARARWSRMTPAQKSQALKKIGVFTLRDAPTSALDRLFDGIMASAREALTREGHFDFQALNDELDRALAPVGAASKGRLAHG